MIGNENYQSKHRQKWGKDDQSRNGEKKVEATLDPQTEASMVQVPKIGLDNRNLEAWVKFIPTR
jgi:hypothetical protein